MTCFARWILVFLAISTAAATAQTQPAPQYIAPSETGPHGSAPGMWVKVLTNSKGTAPVEYAVIFRTGDDPYAGLTQFAAQVPHPERALHCHRRLSRRASWLLRP